MSKVSKHPALVLVLGICIGAAAMWFRPQPSLQAGTASSSDKFSLVTVPVEGIADTEAVFVLDHLTGIVRGGRLNNATASFSIQYLHSVADDFELRAGQRNPEYCIVSGSAQLNAQGNQPARGVLYIAEKSSGQLNAYGFAMPPQGVTGRRNPTVEPLVRLDGLLFREVN